MPTYVYRCPKGHLTEHRRPVDRRDEPVECAELIGAPVTVGHVTAYPRCTDLALRVPAPCAGIFPGAASWRGG